MFRFTLIVCVLNLAGGVAVQAGEAGPMSREEKEVFLRNARVVSIREVGEGVTRPKKVVLEDGPTRMKAIFKAVDMEMEVKTRFGAETVNEYQDSYRAEIAAYELDKLLGLNVLPVIVERKVDGKKGSLREWVEEIMPHYGHGTPPPDMGRANDQIQMVWLFDYLVYNLDRRTHNLMIAPDWSPVLIDHSMTFFTFEKPFRPLYRFPGEVVARLREVGEHEIWRTLSPYLRRNQVDALLKRREILLERVDRLVAAQGEDAVLFSMDAVR